MLNVKPLYGRAAALRAFKIVTLHHALPQAGEVEAMVASLLIAKKQGKLMGMNNGFDNHVEYLKSQGFLVEEAANG